MPYPTPVDVVRTLATERRWLSTSRSVPSLEESIEFDMKLVYGREICGHVLWSLYLPEQRLSCIIAIGCSLPSPKKFPDLLGHIARINAAPLAHGPRLGVFCCAEMPGKGECGLFWNSPHKVEGPYDRKRALAILNAGYLEVSLALPLFEILGTGRAPTDSEIATTCQTLKPDGVYAH